MLEAVLVENIRNSILEIVDLVQTKALINANVIAYQTTNSPL
jgi:hypothetical protein